MKKKLVLGLLAPLALIYATSTQAATYYVGKTKTLSSTYYTQTIFSKLGASYCSTSATGCSVGIAVPKDTCVTSAQVSSSETATTLNTESNVTFFGLVTAKYNTNWSWSHTGEATSTTKACTTTELKYTCNFNKGTSALLQSNMQYKNRKYKVTETYRNVSTSGGTLGYIYKSYDVIVKEPDVMTHYCIGY